MAAFVVLLSLAPLLNFRIFTREAKGGGGVNYRYISHNSVRPQKKEKKNVPKRNSMTVPWQIADEGGRPLRFFFLFLFRDGAENERK
jgi:hypothetical protein